LTTPAQDTGRRAALKGLNRIELAVMALVALMTVLAGITRYAHGVSRTAAFVLATLALAGLAWIVALATEEVGERLGTAATGVMQSTVGNLPEFFVVLFALDAGQQVVAETAILGSILVNALLVLGLVIIAGAWRERERDGIMHFSARLPNDTATLLLVASFIIVLIGLTHGASDPASHHAKTISIVGAAAILVVYGLWLRQYLRSHGAPADTTPPRLSQATALGLLIAGGVGAAFVSDWFVHALTPTIHTLHISRAFAGLVIVAIAGNAVEHVVGVAMAAKGESELAISVVKNSVAQIAAFLFPALVLVSLLTSTTLTFAMSPVYAGALFGTAVIIWQVTGDGEAREFEGAALIAAYVILATVAAFQA
jgi:Ca2+:H+ antiporter